MQKKMLVLAVVAASSLLAACGPKGAGSSSAGGLSTDNQKLGYSIGYAIGKDLSTKAKDFVDLSALKSGLDDGFGGKTPKMDDAARQQIQMSMTQKIMQKQMADMEKKATDNKAAGDKFLADNAKKPGVKTTATGLQYEVLTEGKGEHPTAQDVVTVNYKGTLLDGTVFDSSYDRHEPATFPLGNVIPGWTEGVQLMTPGAKYKFYVPGNLAYGAHGAGDKIGPNATLVFEVELLKVQKAGAAQ